MNRVLTEEFLPEPHVPATREGRIAGLLAILLADVLFYGAIFTALRLWGVL